MKIRTPPAEEEGGGRVKAFLDFTPKDETDYFPLLRWRIGRKLAFTILAAVILVCLAVILLINPLNFMKNARNYPVFNYDSLLLKFYKGKAGIRADDGHIAYIGKVGKGKAEGRGILYDAEENVLYEGNFSDSLYHGKGILYYPGLRKAYEGSFSRGKKHGAGELYNETASLIYKGNFCNDRIVFEELVGLSTAEITKKYQGRQIIYTKDEETAVVMEEIGAVYAAKSGEDSLDGEWKCGGIYVLQGTYETGSTTLQTGQALRTYFGKPEYQGTTNLHTGDAAALEQIRVREGDRTLPRLRTAEGLQDVYEIKEIDKSYEIYISVYQKDGFRYTFFGKGKEQMDTFLFYLIEKAGEEAKE